MAVAIGERDEIALRIDDHLLHPWRAAFEQAAQQMRLSRARIALNEQTGGQQFLKIHDGGRAIRRGAHVDSNGHAPALKSRAEERKRVAADRAGSEPDSVMGVARPRLRGLFGGGRTFTAGRSTEALPPRRPPFFALSCVSGWPRPEPDLLPPPDSLFTVAQARRSASSWLTPRSS